MDLSTYFSALCLTECRLGGEILLTTHNLQQTADTRVSYDQSKLGEIINQQMKRKYSETLANQRLL